MDLKAKSQEISAAFRGYKEELIQLLEAARERQKEIQEDFTAANNQGDANENAALSEAITQLGQNSATMEQYHKQIEALSAITGEDRYNHIGMVKIFSTVHLRSQDGVNYVVKIYPAGVSSISHGVIAADCDIAKAILNHKKGNSVQVEHKTTGRAIKYTIVDLY